jgi:hypothetical protein
MNSNWGPAALIVFGYIVAAYWNSKRFDDFKLWIGAELRRLEGKIDGVEARLSTDIKRLQEKTSTEIKRLEEKIDNSVKRLEDKIESVRSPITGGAR